MTISRILNKKGSYASTVRPTDTIERALDLLASHDIGAIVVTDDDQHIIGILSERDIVRVFQANGSSALLADVASVMTPNPYTCTAEDRIDDVLAKMDQRNFRHAPVVSEGRLAGIISIKDIVKLKLDEVESEAKAIRDYIAA